MPRLTSARADLVIVRVVQIGYPSQILTFSPEIRQGTDIIILWALAQRPIVAIEQLVGYVPWV